MSTVLAPKHGARASRPMATVSLRRSLTKLAVGAWRVACLIQALVLIVWVWRAKDPALGSLAASPLLCGYSLLVGVYWAGRFASALLYRPTPDNGYRPSASILIPAFNEEGCIAQTIDACFATSYDPHRLEVVVVDDGSTDRTWAEIVEAQRRHPALVAIRLPGNRGKREAMAAAVRRSGNEICVFVDSDSVIAPDALGAIMADFEDSGVGAVVGSAEVLNKYENVLTRMQQVRYHVAFRVVKASESLTGAVTCASGCFSAYRRRVLLPVLPLWRRQVFLGLPATYGDDRALTNLVLERWRVVYQSRARVRTIAPSTFSGFVRQQLRWRKSWCRESLIVSKFIWRKNIVASFFTYASTLLQWLAPLVLVYLVCWRVVAGEAPHLYAMGVFVMGVLYSLFYAVTRRSPLWWYGIVFVAVYLLVLVWQTYWAAATLRRTGWGTRTGAGRRPSRRPAARRLILPRGPAVEMVVGVAMLPVTLGFVWFYTRVVAADYLPWDSIGASVFNTAAHGVAAMGLVAVGYTALQSRGHEEERHEFLERRPDSAAGTAQSELGPISPELVLVTPELRDLLHPAGSP